MVVAAVIVPVTTAVTLASVVPVFPAVSAFFVGAVARVIASSVDDGLQDGVARGSRVLRSCRDDGQAAHDDE